MKDLYGLIVHVFICIYICVHIHTYIYMYIYISKLADTEGSNEVMKESNEYMYT
jgi:hypothetical protein